MSTWWWLSRVYKLMPVYSSTKSVLNANLSASSSRMNHLWSSSQSSRERLSRSIRSVVVFVPSVSLLSSLGSQMEGQFCTKRSHLVLSASGKPALSARSRRSCVNLWRASTPKEWTSKLRCAWRSKHYSKSSNQRKILNFVLSRQVMSLRWCPRLAFKPLSRRSMLRERLPKSQSADERMHINHDYQITHTTKVYSLPKNNLKQIHCW